MRLGVCTKFENLDLAAKAGFDYAECNLSALAALKQMQYAGTVSIEAGTCDFAYDAPRAVERLKPLMG